jgi:hypothetical protein
MGKENAIGFKCLLILGFMLSGITCIFCQKTCFPVKISEDKRYLVDCLNKPFFYQAETPWYLFTRLNSEDMAVFMDIRISQGFNVIQTNALIKGTNINRDSAFVNQDFTRPNKDYFGHIRSGIMLAREKGLLVGMAPVWKGCCGGDWNDVISLNGPEKCRDYGRFLGSFFAGCDNLFWIQGGDRDPREHIDHYRQIALGIREFMPDALQTYHASSGHSSTDMVNYLDNSWMNFSWTYTYFRQKHNVWIYLCGWGELPEVYEMNHIEYRKVPVKPFVLGESQYEGEDSSSYRPLRGCEVVRRQAYWSVLSGSCGHAYGSWNWHMGDQWPGVVKDTGAWDMLHVKNLFDKIPWHQLVPDLNGEIIRQGAGTYGKTDYAVASYIPDGNLVVVYIPPTGTEARNLKLDLSKMLKPAKAQWYNPATGVYSDAFMLKEKAAGTTGFVTPGNNGENSNDWVLIIQ